MPNYHGDIALGQRHAIHQWEYADAPTRVAATGFVAGDVHKLALQLADTTYWQLTATTPTWVAVGGGGGFASPMTTLGDQITGGPSGAPGRAPLGAVGTVWTAASGGPAWATPAAGGGGAPATSRYLLAATDAALANGIVVPGLAGSADRAGVGGATIALEFDTTTTGLTASSAPTQIDSNTTIPSALYVVATDITERKYLRPFAPAAGAAFDARCQIAVGANGIVGAAGLIVTDSTGANIALMNLIHNADAMCSLTSYSGSGYATVSIINGLTNAFYLRITRDTANVYQFWWSTTGLIWQRLGSVTIATAVAQIGYRHALNTAGSGQLASDWLRVS